MVNKKSLSLVLLSLVYLITQEVATSRYVFFWVVVLILILIKSKNHFISILLVLEILSLRRIIVIGRFVRINNSVRLLFLLITLRVGEAVLGLAILVKLIR